MNRAAVSVFLPLLMGLVAGCGPKDKSTANSKDGAAPKVAMNKKDSGSKTGKKNSTDSGQGVNDADLLEFDERCKALVSRIRLKMTKKQVESILGTPDDEDEKDLGELNPAKAGQVLETWTWRDEADSNKVIMIGFVNGVLVDAETNALGQHGWNIGKGYRTKPLGK